MDWYELGSNIVDTFVGAALFVILIRTCIKKEKRQ